MKTTAYPAGEDSGFDDSARCPHIGPAFAMTATKRMMNHLHFSHCLETNPQLPVSHQLRILMQLSDYKLEILQDHDAAWQSKVQSQELQ
jgi:hypothetical protein